MAIYGGAHVPHGEGLSDSSDNGAWSGLSAVTVVLVHILNFLFGLFPLPFTLIINVKELQFVPNKLDTGF